MHLWYILCRVSGPILSQFCGLGTVGQSYIRLTPMGVSSVYGKLGYRDIVQRAPRCVRVVINNFIVVLNLVPGTGTPTQLCLEGGKLTLLYIFRNKKILGISCTTCVYQAPQVQSRGLSIMNAHNNYIEVAGRNSSIPTTVRKCVVKRNKEGPSS